MAEGEEEDDDDGFFVPHGYLSNDEGDCSDTEGGLTPDSNVNPNDVRHANFIHVIPVHSPQMYDFVQPQERKNSQLAKAKAWEAEFARKCQLLNKKKIGLLWLNPLTANTSLPDGSASCDEAFLMQFAAVSLVPLPIPHPMASKGESSLEVSSDHHLHQGKACCIGLHY